MSKKKTVYIPKEIFEKIHFTWTQTNADGNDVLDFMHGLQIRKNYKLAQWIRNKKNVDLLIDFYYKKIQLLPLPDIASFEEAVKALMDGNIVSVITLLSDTSEYKVGAKYCYYHGKVYVNSPNGDIWNVRTGFFDYLSKDKFVILNEKLDLSKIKLRGVNHK